MLKVKVPEGRTRRAPRLPHTATPSPSSLRVVQPGCHVKPLGADETAGNLPSNRRFLEEIPVDLWKSHASKSTSKPFQSHFKSFEAPNHGRLPGLEGPPPDHARRGHAEHLRGPCLALFREGDVDPSALLH